MTDTVTINAPVTYRAWSAPSAAQIHFDEDEAFAVPIETLTPEALDALAQQWLDHLYARVGRPSPFRHVAEKVAA